MHRTRGIYLADKNALQDKTRMKYDLKGQSIKMLTYVLMEPSISSTPRSGWVRSRVRVRVITKTLKMVLTGAPQPVVVKMSFSKGNALAVKRHSSYLIQWSSRQRWYN